MVEIKSNACDWTLDDNLGALHCGRLTAAVNLDQPQLGLHRLRIEEAAVAGSLWCVAPNDLQDWPAAVSDRYVRGNDLVAAYAESDTWPYAPQLYWTAVGDNNAKIGALAELSLLVSMQTSLLDTHPRVEVRTGLSAEHLLVLNPAGERDIHFELLPDGDHTFRPASSASCLVWRLRDCPVSYAEVVEASDFRELHVRCNVNGEFESRWQLFAEFLEKGVIRRARVQAAFFPREGDVARAAAFCRAVEKRPLPLTT
jgi:hypothetical protein